MAKYSKTAQKSVESAMHRMKKGTLESGNSEQKVTNPKQAIAIGLSEAREKGAKVPKEKSSTQRSAPKKSAPRKAATKKKAAPKKVAAKKSTAKAKPGPKPGSKKGSK